MTSDHRPGQAAQFNPERLLMSLSGEVAGLRSRVADLARQVAESAAAPSLADLNERLDRLAVQLAEVADNAQQAADAAADSGRPAGPVWDWTRLDAAEASDAWRQLAWWVPTVLLARNPMLLGKGEMWAACWYAHPDVVDELSALYGVWWEAFCSRDASAARVAEWRDRWLPGALRRIADSSMKSCARSSSTTHSLPPPRDSRQTSNEHLAAFVNDDLARRSAAPASH